MTLEIRLIGILALLTLAWGKHMGQLNLDNLPGHYPNPVLAMELVRDGHDLNLLLLNDKATSFIEKQLGQDSLFIVLYVSLLGTLGHLTSRLSPGAIGKAGLLASALIILAGLLDLLENRGMRNALATKPGSADDALAHSIRYPSLGKWELFYLVVLLIGLLLTLKGSWLLIPGVSLAASGIIGLSGVVANLIVAKFYPMFPAALYAMLPAAVFVIVGFTFFPRLVLRN